MTAHAMEGEREKCLSYGMNEYISKPIKENDLYRIICQFVTIHPVKKNDQNTASNKPHYYTIDLEYIREISKGNKRYEKTVTEQFINEVPEEIASMNNALEAGDYLSLKKIAHNMKTTISIMSLNNLLNEHLDAIENNMLNKEQLKLEATAINNHLKKALTEANLFFKTL